MSDSEIKPGCKSKPRYNQPDEHGHFGVYGGRFVSETLTYALDELLETYERWRDDESFRTELASYLRDFVGRPTPLYFAENLTRELGGARVYLKREDLAHTGAHKINNTVGQGLLAKRMGKPRVIAETGSARRRHRHDRGAARARVSCVHG